MAEISEYRSEIENLLKEAGSLRHSNPNALLEKSEELLQFGQVRGDDASMGFGGFLKGEAYYYLNDIPSFYLEMLKCIKPLSRIREWGYVSKVYNYFGVLSKGRGNIPLALDYYYKALDYCETYRLFDIKCLVQKNLGDLYLSCQRYDEAVSFYDESFKFISNHVGMEGFVDNITGVLLGKAKALLFQDKLQETFGVLNDIKQRSQAFLKGALKFSLDSFEAGFLHALGKESECDALISQINSEFKSDISVMEIYEDIRDYLKLLLEKSAYEKFVAFYAKASVPVQGTEIKNFEKGLLEQKLICLKECGSMDEYHKSSERFIEILSAMESENLLNASAMINLKEEVEKFKEEAENERKKTAALKLLSESDPLTGMPNRRRLNAYGEEIFNRTITNQVGFAIEVLDIDYFKEYNESYGRQAGDDCLLFVGKTIMKLTKGHEGLFCTRYTGDGFVIMYEGLSEKDVFDIAKRLKNTIVDVKKPHENSPGNEKFITISQGIYWGMPVEGETIWEYLYEAEVMLSKVKKKSKNSVMLGKSKAVEDGEDKKTKSEHFKKPVITEVKESEYTPDTLYT